MTKRIAIHQPNYLPWPGYFLKMMLSDQFVFLDHVQFSKPSYTHRASFKLPNGQMTYLSIPTSSVANRKNINEVVSSNVHWRKTHRNKLNEWLKDYPFYEDLNFLWGQYEDSLERTLADFNLQTLKLLTVNLDIEFESLKSSKYNYSSSGTSLIVDILEHQNATQYITGVGFLNYYDEIEWSKKIVLQVIDFKKVIDNSELSTHSIIENIAKLGLTQTKCELSKICDKLKP